MPNDPNNNAALIRSSTMKPLFSKTASLFPVILLTTTLASCGGGGGGGNAEAPVPSFQGVVTSVPAVTYTAENLAISNGIVAIRQVAGGLLAQNAALDTAAAKHAAFLVENNLVSNATYLATPQTGGILGGHFEDSGASVMTNYTGASPQTRAAAAGYTGSVAEVMTFGSADGAACVASLENSVYHLIAMISPFIDIGVGFNAGTGSGSACAIEFGVKSTTLGQLPVHATFYPDGQINIAPTFYNQAEVPVPASDLPKAGHPVVASLYTLANPSLAASDIVMHAFSITKHGETTALTNVRVLAKTGVTSDGANSPTLVVDDEIPAAGFVVLLPALPLEANTAYDLSFSATVKGISVTKDWSFTTGSAN